MARMEVIPTRALYAKIGKGGQKSMLTKEIIGATFKRNDSNGDGVLNLKELKKAFDELGSRWAFGRAICARITADGNGDGVIDCFRELDTLVDYTYELYVATA